ncbi:MAG TPA: hypothetical protein VHH73_11295 [Verrucomicrobiae bacterium]|nr:hypothetical protein [Verrucomicrobiae bacterium]
MARWTTIWAGVWLIIISAFAAAPTLEHFYPVAIQIGVTNAVAAIGKFDPWPVKVWSDAPGIFFTARTNKGEFDVSMAANAKAGPHLVRVYNEQGASEPRFLILTGEPQQAEAEPNDDYRQPQKLEHFPVSLNGRLDRGGDVDSYAIPLERGETLVASIEAYVLGSPMDAALQLVDTRGVQVAFNHDDGITLDPLLTWRAQAAGIYVLQVFAFSYPADSTVAFAGGKNFVYRLHAWRGPYARHMIPLGVQREAHASFSVVAWNTNGLAPLEFDATSLPVGAKHLVWRPPGYQNTVELPMGDGPELREQEPDDAVAEARLRLEIPGAVTGVIDRSGDEDRYWFIARRGTRYVFQIDSTGLGFPTYPWVQIEDKKGKALARQEEGQRSDPTLEWLAPRDGDFLVAVGNIVHRGGPDYLYRLSVRRAVPNFTAISLASALLVEPGKTNEVKITVRRREGERSAVLLSARNLPDGVTMDPVLAPENEETTTLRLVAADEARPFSGPVQLVAAVPDEGVEGPVIHEMTTTSIQNGVPNGYSKLVIESTDQIWLTIPPKPPKEAKPEKK